MQRNFGISPPADLPLRRGVLVQVMLDILTVLVWACLGVLGFIAFTGPFLALGWMIFFN